MERYLKVGGKYHYEINNALVSITDEVAICFDKESQLLLEHGDPAEVMEYYDEALERFKEVNWPEARKDMVMVVAEFPIRELNKLMLNKGYLAEFIENNKDMLSGDVMQSE